MISPFWADNLKAPLISVLVPTPARSFRYTLTPGSDSLLSSNTCPEIVNCFYCPIIIDALQKNSNDSNMYFFISVFFTYDYWG